MSFQNKTEKGQELSRYPLRDHAAKNVSVINSEWSREESGRKRPDEKHDPFLGHNVSDVLFDADRMIGHLEYLRPHVYGHLWAELLALRQRMQALVGFLDASPGEEDLPALQRAVFGEVTPPAKKPRVTRPALEPTEVAEFASLGIKASELTDAGCKFLKHKDLLKLIGRQPPVRKR